MPDEMITAPQSDQTYSLERDPIPQSPPTDNPWLPKTDWGRDRIIASEDGGQ